MVYLERWKKLFERIGCKKSPDNQFHNLIRAYSEKHRAYHNLNHVEQCLKEFDEINNYLESSDLVELAIWYHDAVYSTRSDSEKREKRGMSVTK